MIENKKALLLDMNNTFMFNEDRFGEKEDYSKYYQSMGGQLSADSINNLIRKVFAYLNEKYPDEAYRHCFPSLEKAIDACTNTELSDSEKEKIIETFSFHEHGEIPDDYVNCLKRLNKYFILSLVIDIWAPKNRWINTFQRFGLWELFSAHSFSSDHGMVKPSPKPFEIVVDKLDIPKQNCLMVGDSARRDLGGAEAAGLDCVLVGVEKDEKALACFPTLLDFLKMIEKHR